MDALSKRSSILAKLYFKSNSAPVLHLTHATNFMTFVGNTGSNNDHIEGSHADNRKESEEFVPLHVIILHVNPYPTLA